MGVDQNIYSLRDAPKYFKLDVSVFDQNTKETLDDFMEIERHGQPVVPFDKLDLIKPRYVNRKLLLERHKIRIADIEQSFPIFKSKLISTVVCFTFISISSAYLFLGFFAVICVASLSKSLVG